MSKYDFELDLSDQSSTGIILSKIAPGSAVLEFGCATGRMTRYMKEHLGCSVYIVEYEREAYDVAIEYADGGVCGDIMEFAWLEAFSHISFDAIIFSDVLEHLMNPELALKKAAELLKEYGQIYISIPNITHNDILLKAYDDHFDYTATGLLDNSHIHFWGVKNLAGLADVCGLSIRQLEATYSATGHTEQYAGEEKNENILLNNLLRERVCGEVYQFILTLEKKTDTEPMQEKLCNFEPPSIMGHIYVDTGNDFNDNQVIAVKAFYNGNGSYIFHYVLDDIKGVKRIKFDPVEGQHCILKNVAISQDGVKLPLIYTDGIADEKGLLLNGSDPMVYVSALLSSEPVVIDAEIVLWGAEYLKLLEEICFNQYHALNQMKQSFDDTLLAQANKNQAVLDKERAVLQHEIAVLRQDIDSYVTLATRKDKYIVEAKQRLNKMQNSIQDKEREIAVMEESHAALLDEIQECNRILAEKDAYIIALEKDREYFKNLPVVRVRTKLVRILKGVLRKS